MQPKNVATPAEAPTVFVIDDEFPVRSGLVSQLRSAGHKVLMFPSAGEFVEGPAPDACGCLVARLQQPSDLPGLELLRALQRRESVLSTVLISRLASVPLGVHAMKLGAHDFLTVPYDHEHLLDVVDSALSLSASRWTERQALFVLRARYGTLTPRQREVCGLVSDGLLNKQIASALGTSERTIKVHRAGVMTKMQAGSVAELVRIVDRLAVGWARESEALAAPSYSAAAPAPGILPCA